MNNNVNVGNGNISTLCSILLGIFTWFTPENVESSLRIVSGIGSIGAAVMAIRYYYFATIEKKKSIREKKNK